MKTIFLIVPLILLLFSSCSGSIEQSERDKIFNKTLVLAELDSVKYAENEKSGGIFIKLNYKDNKGSITGFGGCNDIYGSFISTIEGVPKFKLEMTDKYCDKSAQEKKLVEILNNLTLIEAAKNNIAYFYSDSPRHYARFKIME